MTPRKRLSCLYCGLRMPVWHSARRAYCCDWCSSWARVERQRLKAAGANADNISHEHRPVVGPNASPEHQAAHDASRRKARDTDRRWAAWLTR